MDPCLWYFDLLTLLIHLGVALKSRAVVIVGVVASVLIGLLGLFVGIMNTFTHWCGEDCGSDASRITFGLIQVVAALLLLAGAYLAARLKPNARWVWIAAIVVSVPAYFWAWFILVPGLVLVALGVWALWPRKTTTAA
jgi:hypothetical protein